MARIQLRTEDAVKQKINDLAVAAEMSLTSFMIARALGTVIRPGITKELKEISNELKAWGNNLNQIAKGINQASQQGDLKINQQLGRDIDAIKQALDNLEMRVKGCLEAGSPEDNLAIATQD